MNESMLKEYSPEYNDFMISVMYYMGEHHCTKEEAIQAIKDFEEVSEK